MFRAIAIAITVLLFLLCNYCTAQTFTHVYGNPTLNESGVVIVKSPDGNLFMGGFSSDSAMIMKIDPVGNLIWSKTFIPITGSNYFNFVRDLEITPDSMLIGVGNAIRTTPYSQQGFYFKFDLNGNMAWCKTVTRTSGSLYCSRMLPKSPAEYILIENSYNESGGSYDDVITARVDASNGSTTWSSDRINYMSVNPYIDNVGAASFGRNHAFYTTGRIYINGSSPTGMRPFLSKFDNMGNILWSKYLLYSQAQSAILYGEDVIYDNDSIVISYLGSRTGVAGSYTNGLIKLDTLGNIIWSKDYDIIGSPSEIVDKIVRLPNGYLLVGYSNEFSATTTRHMFAIATDLNGNFQWAKSFGSPTMGQYEGYDPFRIAEIVGNTVYLACQQTNGTQTDAYLVAMDLSGNVSCPAPVSLSVVQSNNPTYSAFCNMTFLPIALNYSSVNTIQSRPVGDQCSAYQLNLGNDTTTCSSITLNATIPGATYQWQNGSVQSTFNTTGPGTYWVNVSVNCCFLTDTIHVLQASISAAVSTSDVTCNGGNNGSATANPSGGTGPYTFSWTPGSGTGATVSGLTAQNYTCTITDGGGCSTTQTFSISQPSALTATSSHTDITCNGNTNGSAIMSVSGGTPGYSYSWMPTGGNAALAGNLSAGTYTCIITDVNGCVLLQTVTITQPTVLTATTSAIPSGCNSNFGSVMAVAGGGSGGYTYLWSDGGVGMTENNVALGSYSVTVTDVNGCTVTSTVTLANNNLTVNLQSINDVTCYGGSDGAAMLNVTGNGPFTYSWSPFGGTAANAMSLSAQTYSVTVTDIGGCTTVQTVVITEPAQFVTATSFTMATCSINNGSATVNVSGGTLPYTYQWNNSQTTATAINLAGGTYFVTVTDANGCAVVDSIMVASTTMPTVTIQSFSNVTCYGSSDGAAMLNVIGNGPFTYSWSPYGGTTANATNLSAQTYSVTVTDAGGCMVIQTVIITQPPQLITATSFTTATCSANNGSATVNVSGGTSPYTYLWNNSQTTVTALNLSGGTYSIVVTDANGCVALDSVTVASTTMQIVTIQSFSNVTCFGGSDGAASVNVSGGQSPFMYSWSPTGQLTSSPANLMAGTYTVTVTGSDGCVANQTVIITEPPAIAINDVTTPENCNMADGSASVIVNGGTSGYSYLWSNGDTTSSISNLTVGSYSVTITDANGCIAVFTSTVSSTAAVIANAGGSVTITSGQSTQLNGSGGGTYSWYPQNDLNCSTCQNPIASPTITTTYTLVVTDSAGCTAMDTVTVFVDIDCGSVFVPNAFSPNGDNHNDILYARGNCIKFMQFTVYNRWGERVFISTDPGVGWDGTWRGQECESAVFTYILHATLLDGTSVERKGNVTLVK